MVTGNKALGHAWGYEEIALPSNPTQKPALWIAYILCERVCKALIQQQR